MANLSVCARVTLCLHSAGKAYRWGFMHPVETWRATPYDARALPRAQHVAHHWWFPQLALEVALAFAHGSTAALHFVRSAATAGTGVATAQRSFWLFAGGGDRSNRNKSHYSVSDRNRTGEASAENTGTAPRSLSSASAAQAGDALGPRPCRRGELVSS